MAGENPNDPPPVTESEPTPEVSGSGGDNSTLGGWEIAVGVLSLGVISLGLGLYNHWQSRKAMQEAVKNIIRDEYDVLLSDKAKEKLGKDSPGKKYTEEEIQEAKYALTPQEIKEATEGEHNKEKVWERAASGLSNQKESFVKNVQSAWRISGGITAFGIAALVIGLMVTPVGLMIGLTIGVGIVSALIGGAIAGKIASSSAKSSTNEFMSKCLDDPELQKGRTKEYEQGLEGKRDKLKEKVLNKGKESAGQDAEKEGTKKITADSKEMNTTISHSTATHEKKIAHQHHNVGPF